ARANFVATPRWRGSVLVGADPGGPRRGWSVGRSRRVVHDRLRALAEGLLVALEAMKEVSHGPGSRSLAPGTPARGVRARASAGLGSREPIAQRWSPHVSARRARVLRVHAHRSG